MLTDQAGTRKGINPSFGHRKMVGGGATKTFVASIGDDTIPRDGQLKNLSAPPTHNLFLKRNKNTFPLPPLFPCWTPGAAQSILLLGRLRPPDHPSLIPLNMSFVGHATWKSILFSELKTGQVFTIFGFENFGSVHYFRNSKPWKCILFSDLETMNMYIIFGIENPRNVYYLCY